MFQDEKKGCRSPIVIAEELTILVDVSGLSGRGVSVLLLGDEEVEGGEGAEQAAH